MPIEIKCHHSYGGKNLNGAVRSARNYLWKALFRLSGSRGRLRPVTLGQLDFKNHLLQPET